MCFLMEFFLEGGGKLNVPFNGNVFFGGGGGVFNVP